jgi:Tol biopolymer transport system component/predicted Ser/Thr protein kinase
MPLPPGTCLGRYEILELIGTGGMGEVYRARDPRMDRTVAIKVSAEQFTERFDLEVRAVAALNHPNICQIYDVGQNYLVMELIEGESPVGPLPLETVLEYARQIADALSAAHEKGVVHRDLKPENIKVLPDGRVKVLDFGLAKMTAKGSGTWNAAVSVVSPSDAATMGPVNSTQAGAAIGTPRYMSPEQARGLVVDRRTDIWAFGVVIYELLTGTLLWPGDSVADVLAQVLTVQPNLTRVPVQVRTMLAVCLEKDPGKRLNDIRDYRLLLVDGAAETADGKVVQRGWRRWVPWALAAVLLVSLAAMVGEQFRSKPVNAAIVRFDLAEPGTANCIFFLSPDGRTLAYTARGEDGVTRLWVRALDSVDARMVPGTEDVGGLIWSPDGRRLAYSVAAKLKKVDLSGGPPVELTTLATASEEAERPGIVPGIRGGSWNQEGTIVFGAANVLYKVADSGGDAVQLTALDATKQEQYHARPLFLPDGRHFLYLRASDVKENGGLYVGSIDAKPGDQSRERVLDVQTGVGLASAGGVEYMLYLRNQVLFAQEFDLKALKLTGEPVPVAENVGDNGIAAGFFSVSQNGILVYRENDEKNSRLTFLDRSGKAVRTIGEVGEFNTMALSPDGTAVAVERVDSMTRNSDLWVFRDGGGSMRLTFDASRQTSPVWSADGRQVVFYSDRGGQHGVYEKATSGAGGEQLLFQSKKTMTPSTWTSDSKYLLGYNTLGEGHLWMLELGSQAPVPLFTSQFNEVGARLSYDNRWIAYRSNESGRFEIYVRQFDERAPGGPAANGSEWTVSRGGGDGVRWRKDGNEVYYMAPDGTLMAAEVVKSGEGLEIKTPKALFRAQVYSRFWDVTADGQQFLFPLPVGGTVPKPFRMVLNWTAGLKR